METPSSTTRRVTRSQTLISSSTNANLTNNIPISRKIEDSEKGVSKSRPRTGALIDITNDSPIVGLAMGKLETPSSALSKKGVNLQLKDTCTPGSGEALLRGQVKTLLQKVEEEAEVSKISLENKQFLNFQGLVSSPITLLAPTPANTPQIENLLGTESFKNACLADVTPSPVQEQLMVSQMVTDIVDAVKQEGSEFEKNFITRSLLFDFSDKSEGSNLSGCSSVLTSEGDNNLGKKKSSDDDDSSVWSIQVNASTGDDDVDEDLEDGIEEDHDYGYKDEVPDDDDAVLVDELCEGISKIRVNGVEFKGKHTRFLYNSDGEIEGEEEECSLKDEKSPGIVRLKGLPTPKGKHSRFPEDD